MTRCGAWRGSSAICVSASPSHGTGSVFIAGRAWGRSLEEACGHSESVTPRLVDLLLMRSRANTLVLHHALVSTAAVARAHARGAPVVAWTVDDPQDFRRVDEAGVDAIVTNDPSIFVSTLTT